MSGSNWLLEAGTSIPCVHMQMLLLGGDRELQSPAVPHMEASLMRFQGFLQLFSLFCADSCRLSAPHLSLSDCLSAEFPRGCGQGWSTRDVPATWQLPERPSIDLLLFLPSSQTEGSLPSLLWQRCEGGGKTAQLRWF